MSVKEDILNRLFPDNMFNIRNPRTGHVDLELAEERIGDTIDEYESALDDIPSIPQLPSIGNLLAKIPTIERPNPAEIRKFINDRLEEKRRQLQEQLITKLVNEATKEELPFTARRELNNILARQNSRGKNYG